MFAIKIVSPISRSPLSFAKDCKSLWMENLSEFEHLSMRALPCSLLKTSLVSVDLSSPKTAVAISRSNVSGRTLKDTSASWSREDSLRKDDSNRVLSLASLVYSGLSSNSSRLLLDSINSSRAALHWAESSESNLHSNHMARGTCPHMCTIFIASEELACGSNFFTKALEDNLSSSPILVDLCPCRDISK